MRPFAAVALTALVGLSCRGGDDAARGRGATVRGTSGRVDVLVRGHVDDWTALADGARLGAHARLRVATGAQARLEWADGSSLRLESGTLAALDDGLTIERGRAVGTLRPTLRVHTPALTATATATSTATATATPAEVVIEANGDGETVVEARRGEVTVTGTTGGPPLSVHEGQAAAAMKNESPSIRLPPPTLLSPADGATVGALDITVSWAPVADAARYLVEIASDPEFHAVRTVSVTTTATQLHLDPASTWYWRVVALDREGKTGRVGSARRLTIDVAPSRLMPGKPE